jgi:hypothetical protein
MRPLTPFVSYNDNTGHPLVGRIQFCNTDASPAEVFASDGTTSLGSSVFTDSSGRPVQQPFLEDKDYLLFFDKYVGHATMTEDDDKDSWEEQGSAIDRYDVFGVSVDCGTVVSVATLEVLRNTAPDTVTPFDGVYMVDLLGYDEVGDKPVLRYVWDAENTDSDDGGSVIAVDDVETGRWVIKDRPEYVDSRHFGAFPNSTATAYPTQRYDLQRAALWAHDNGLGLYLHADDTHAYYDISGLNIYNLKCAPGATVFTITGSVTNIIGLESVTVHSANGLEGTTVLNDKVVRTSWAGTSAHTRLSPTERLVIDSAFSGVQGLRSWSGVAVDMYDTSNNSLSFTDCIVYVHEDMDPENSVSFDSCSFVAHGTMDGYISFSNCFIPAGIFAHDFDASNCSVTDCTVAPADEWEDVKDWLALKISNGDWEYDFRGTGSIEMLITKPAGSTGTLIVKNSKDLVLKASGTIPKLELVDCTGTTISVFSSSSKLVVNGGSVDGSVTLLDEVYFGRATVAGNFTVYSSVGADGCVFSPTSSVIASYIRLSNCRADEGSVFAELGTSSGIEGSVYDNCTISGEVSGYKSTVRNSHVARLTVLGLVAGSTSFPWESVIDNSRVDDCRLQVYSTNKPAFSWKNSSINITQYGATYDVPGQTYTREWNIENCDVTFGNRKFYKSSTMFKAPVAVGDIKKLPHSASGILHTYYVCVPLDDLLLFENFFHFSESSVAVLVNYFGYAVRVFVDCGYTSSHHLQAYVGRIVNVSGTLCLFLGTTDAEIAVNPGDTLYVDYDIVF